MPSRPAASSGLPSTVPSWLQLRPQPPALAVCRSGGVHPRLPHRIYHMHVKDAARTLNGKSGILGSHLNFGDPRRGWDFCSPGRGQSIPTPSLVLSTKSATPARCRSNGKTRGWIENTAPPRPPASSRKKWDSSPPADFSIRHSPKGRRRSNRCETCSGRSRPLRWISEWRTAVERSRRSIPPLICHLPFPLAICHFHVAFPAR